MGKSIEAGKHQTSKDTIISQAIQKVLGEYIAVDARYYINHDPENYQIAAKVRASYPYVFVKGRRQIIGVKKGGKLTPEEIAIRQSKKIDPDNPPSNQELGKGEYAETAGVDCSGFAYHCLNRAYIALTGKADFEQLIQGVISKKDGKVQYGVTKTNADALTSKRNCTDIQDVKKARPGDLISINNGKHVIVVVEANKNRLKCVHSSDTTKISGPHEFEIIIPDKEKNIFLCLWKDKLAVETGLNTIGDLILKGTSFERDGLKRLKIFF